METVPLKDERRDSRTLPRDGAGMAAGRTAPGLQLRDAMDCLRLRPSEYADNMIAGVVILSTPQSGASRVAIAEKPAFHRVSLRKVSSAPKLHMTRRRLRVGLRCDSASAEKPGQIPAESARFEQCLCTIFCD